MRAAKRPILQGIGGKRENLRDQTGNILYPRGLPVRPVATLFPAVPVPVEDEAPIAWSKTLDLGIGVIDSQHRCIVAYINALEDAQLARDKTRVGAVSTPDGRCRRN